MECDMRSLWQMETLKVRPFVKMYCINLHLKKSLIYQLFEANSFYHFFSNGFNISIKILVENI